MHPALRSWRNDLPPNIVRLLAYLGAIALLSMASAHFSQSPKVMGAITPVHQPEWIDIERPFAAFALSIPEAADVPASYAIRRHTVGNGRKDILTLGELDSTAPLLRVEIHRPGNEIGRYALCARLRQSTHTAVRLVLSGRHRVRRAKHARVCA
jgi:hypothetical protein